MNIDKILLSNGESLIKVLGLTRDTALKPLHIEDAIWHLLEDDTILNPIKYYNLLNDGVKSVRVYRHPYIGILSDSIFLSKLLSHIMNSISIKGLVIGEVDLYSKPIDKFISMFNVVDLGLIILKDPYKIPCNRIQLDDNINICLVSRDPLAISVDYLGSIGLTLYYIRPALNILYKNPILFYPFHFKKLSYYNSIVYLSKNYNTVDDVRNLHYTGFRVGDENLYILEDLTGCF